jgi:hypothetical protein
MLVTDVRRDSLNKPLSARAMGSPPGEVLIKSGKMDRIEGMKKQQTFGYRIRKTQTDKPAGSILDTMERLVP